MSLTKRGRLMVVLGVFLAILGTPVLAANFYLRSVGVWGSSDPGEVVQVVVPKGAGVSQIGTILEERGVIKSATGFRIATYVGEGAEQIQAGEYQMPRGLTAGDALDWLLGNNPAGEEFVNVTFREGLWLEDFAAVLDRDTDLSGKAFLNLATNGEVRSKYQPKQVDTLEGLLFPSTYQIVEKDTERTILDRLVAEFEKQFSSLDFSTAKQLNLTRYDVAIVASMIEAETRVDSERPKVAQVIYNRLREGMTLGIDATVLYALGEHKQSLTQSDLEVDSPYNTRKNPGLPPTPIGAPSSASLEAALNPADGDWLYYVLADCEGNHAFSSSYDEFLQDKSNYQGLEC
ncbi:MAG TPA: endolytic transglycosylase MltG [Actinomycetota bacterium]|nr:endolytic transglycosylase MltG [Actinomycetota bacterium]